MPFDETLIEILRWIEGFYPGRMTITSGHRRGDNGVHGTVPCRGTDLRGRNYTNPKKIAEHINQVWKYDYRRPELKVCVYHGTDSTKHLHIQSHENTVRVM